MPVATNQGVELEYDTFGDPADPTILLIQGYTAQMTAWDPEFCKLLVDEGHHVVRFDNRDCGLSSKTEGDPPNVFALLASTVEGKSVDIEVPYTLSEMAADAMAVLDAVGVEQAHLIGASMGGMIAQQAAIEYPQRVLTLTSIMSTTGAPGVGQASPEAMTKLLTPPPAERDAYVAHSVEVGRVISGPLFDADVAADRLGKAYDRAYYPAGAPFQLAAIAKTGDRTDGLRKVDIPTLVIHGAADTLVGPSGGEATAEAVPGARLLMLEEMGHDMPPSLWPEMVSAITKVTRAGA